MSRPLLSLGIAQLEELFATANSDRKVLARLRDELQHRNVPRAIALLAKVTTAIEDATISTLASPSDSPPARAPEGQPDLWGGGNLPLVPQTPVESSPRIDRASPTRVEPSTRPSSMPNSSADGEADTDFEMPVDEAYKVLRLTPASTWEDIELARRRLVQLAHPDALVSLSPDQRAEVALKSRRANAASRAIRVALASRI